MTLEEVICRERKTVAKLYVNAKKAKSHQITEERRQEAEYHEAIVYLLKELKERRAR